MTTGTSFRVIFAKLLPWNPDEVAYIKTKLFLAVFYSKNPDFDPFSLYSSPNENAYETKTGSLVFIDYVMIDSYPPSLFSRFTL